MTVQVVELLEVVEVEQRDAERRLGAGGVQDLALEILVPGAAVRQAGERVGACRQLEPRGEQLALADELAEREPRDPRDHHPERRGDQLGGRVAAAVQGGRRDRIGEADADHRDQQLGASPVEGEPEDGQQDDRAVGGDRALVETADQRDHHEGEQRGHRLHPGRVPLPARHQREDDADRKQHGGEQVAEVACAGKEREQHERQHARADPGQQTESRPVTLQRPSADSVESRLDQRLERTSPFAAHLRYSKVVCFGVRLKALYWVSAEPLAAAALLLDPAPLREEDRSAPTRPDRASFMRRSGAGDADGRCPGRLRRGHRRASRAASRSWRSSASSPRTSATRAPNEVAATLRRDLHTDVVVAANLNSVQGVEPDQRHRQTRPTATGWCLRSGRERSSGSSCWTPTTVRSTSPAARGQRPARGRFRRSAQGPDLRHQGVPDVGPRRDLTARGALPRRLASDGRRLLQRDAARRGRRGGLLPLLRAARRAGRLPRHRDPDRPEPEADRAARGAAGALRAGTGPDGLPACDHLRPPARDRDR